MAKTIATIGGYALAPGVSKNRRWYTPEHIRGAVKLAQERLAAGDEPMVMLSHHDAGDDSLRIAATLREVTLTDDGRIRWQAGIPDTETGRDIAKLADTSDKKPAFLEGVSIRGRWLGKVRQVKAPDGELAEQGEGLALDGLDFTHKPGVAGARIDTFAWARGGASETSDPVLITESVQEALVTAITEETEPADEVAEGGNAPGNGKLPYGNVTYADPGYQADKKKRYPLDTEAHIRNAWSRINQPGNAGKYQPAQLKRIKRKIKVAMTRIGAKVTDEGWVIWPAEQVTEALAEYYDGAAPASAAGSFRICATNGPLCVEISSYCVDPADLELILAAAAQSASGALKSIDPDMDGDIDVDGVGPGSDTDSDAAGDTTDQFDNDDGTADLTRRIMAAIKGESAESLDALVAEARTTQARSTEVAETSPDSPAASPDAASQEGDPAVSETTTQEAAGQATAAPTFTQADIDAAVQRTLDAQQAARKAAKAAKAARKAKPAETAKPAKETVTETSTAQPDLEKLVADGIAAQLAAQGLTETTEQKIARLVAEGVTRAKQEMTAAGGGPGRKGLVTETGTPGAATADAAAASFMRDGQVVPMEQWTEDQRRDAGMALQTYVLRDRAVF
ncbi:MAG TPA: DUF6582 domain-containing protein [Streptosporangiaceae bacterium]|nr:DUF6582 domain-containing protein [Streptosporangiaceae bacterium]